MAEGRRQKSRSRRGVGAQANGRAEGRHIRGNGSWSTHLVQRLAVGETIILLHPPLPLVGVSIWMEMGMSVK